MWFWKQTVKNWDGALVMQNELAVNETARDTNLEEILKVSGRQSLQF
jgi:hypothetical protein